MSISDSSFISYLAKCLEDQTSTPLREILEIWIELTGLEVSDALYLSASKIVEDLEQGYQVLLVLSGVVKNDSQLREMICRKIAKFKLSGPPIEEDGFTAPTFFTVAWNGTSWAWVSDPKNRTRSETNSLREAVSQLR
jgi:hypothetical protein